MVLADADGFWKAPNVYDVIGVGGFVVGVGSVWLSWWLAKRDIEKRLSEAADRASEAARAEVRRVAQIVLHSGVTDTIRSLTLAREACHGKQWFRGAEHCQPAREQLTLVLAQAAIPGESVGELPSVSAAVLDCQVTLLVQSKPGTGRVPSDVHRTLDTAVLTVRRVEGKLIGIRPEFNNG